MNEPRHDDERLAALLEGRLEGLERDELLAHLAAADEDFHVYATTAAILREMEEEGEEKKAAQAQQPVERADSRLHVLETVPPSARAGWRRKAPRWIAISAVLAGLVVASSFASRMRANAAGEPLRIAARLEAPRDLQPEWAARTRPWDTNRNGGTDGTDAELGVQAGALLVDLAVAVRLGDSANTGNLAARLREYDRQGSSALEQIEESPNAPPATLQRLLQEAEEGLKGRFDAEPVRLGGWTEAALLAATARDAEFFRTGPTEQMLRRAGTFTRDDPAAREALAAVRTALPAEGEPEWSDLAASLRDLLGAMGS